MLVAIETSTDVGSVALGTGAELAGEVVVGARTRHAQAVLPALEFLLNSAEIPRSELTGIVVGAGPGSFTGVRVAAATARGLAHGLDVPLYAWSSLAALALEAAAADRPVCALFDARRGEVYAACYRRTGEAALETLLEPAACDVGELVDRLAPLDPVYVGDGARRYADRLGIVAPPAAWPRASALLRLHDAAPDAGRIMRTAGWEPDYLRASGAERGIAG